MWSQGPVEFQHDYYLYAYVRNLQKWQRNYASTFFPHMNIIISILMLDVFWPGNVIFWVCLFLHMNLDLYNKIFQFYENDK